MYHIFRVILCVASKPSFLTHPLCANCTAVSNRTILKVHFSSWQRFPSKQQYVYFYLILNYPTGQLPQTGGLMYAPKIEACYMHSFITENSICPFVLTAGRRPLYCLVLLYYNIQIQRGLAGSVCLTLWPSGRWAISSLPAPVFCSAEVHLRVFNLLHVFQVPFFRNYYKENVPGSSKEHLLIPLSTFYRHEPVPVGMPVKILWIIVTTMICFSVF